MESSSTVLQNRHNGRSAYAVPMTFGKRLAAVRKERGLTQQDLGRGLGTDGADAGKQVVYGWEKDQHFPKVDQLILICRKLKCSADYLLFGVQDGSPRLIHAKQAVQELTDEERLALFATIQGPPALGGEKLPPAPPVFGVIAGAPIQRPKSEVSLQTKRPSGRGKKSA